METTNQIETNALFGALLTQLTSEVQQQYKAKTEELDRLCGRLESLLAKYEQKDSDKVFDLDEVAEYLKKSKQTIYTRVNKNTIPYYKMGGKLRFKKSDIDEWNLGKKQLTVSDIDKQAENYILTH